MVSLVNATATVVVVVPAMHVHAVDAKGPATARAKSAAVTPISGTSVVEGTALAIPLYVWVLSVLFVPSNELQTTAMTTSRKGNGSGDGGLVPGAWPRQRLGRGLRCTVPILSTTLLH